MPAADLMATDRHMASNDELQQGELANRSRHICAPKGKSLKNMMLAYINDMDVVDISPKAPSLGGSASGRCSTLPMLVTESDRARAIRRRMLDIELNK